MGKRFLIPVVTLVFALVNPCWGGELKPVAAVGLSGPIKAPEEVSAIAKMGSLLVIGSDEAVGEDEDENYVQVLRSVAKDRYEVDHDILLFRGSEEDGKEMDIEGIATAGDTVYVVGSHSARRKRVKEDKKYKTNRRTFRNDEIDRQKNRGWLYRLRVDSQGREADRDRISLREIFEEDKILKTFRNIPSKENGVDVEGIAVKGEWLYLGFRGPVFRENYVPVMKLQYEDPEDTYELLYVKLGGRGIRGMETVSSGFIIVAGPVGDGPASYQFYHWDGKDTIPGKGRAADEIGKVQLLGEIEPPNGAKAEGITVVEENDTSYELIVVYDGAVNGGAQLFQVPKP